MTGQVPIAIHIALHWVSHVSENNRNKQMRYPWLQGVTMHWGKYVGKYAMLLVRRPIMPVSQGITVDKVCQSRPQGLSSSFCIPR